MGGADVIHLWDRRRPPADELARRCDQVASRLLERSVQLVALAVQPAELRATPVTSHASRLRFAACCSL